jgi:hypothetical protein
VRKVLTTEKFNSSDLKNITDEFEMIDSQLTFYQIEDPINMLDFVNQKLIPFVYNTDTLA